MKGTSGNPGGRPKEIAELRELAREHTEEAISTLIEIMQDKTAPHAARIKASECLLDRGYGKPAQLLETRSDNRPSFFDQVAMSSFDDALQENTHG